MSARKAIAGVRLAAVLAMAGILLAGPATSIAGAAGRHGRAKARCRSSRVRGHRVHKHRCKPAHRRRAKPHRPPGSSSNPAGSAGGTTQSTTGTSSSGPQTTWAPVGALPSSDTQAASRVAHVAETRPANAAADDYVPSDAELQAFHTALDSYGQSADSTNPLRAYVTGRPGLSHPSTDDLIQWSAHKWGIPEDWIRAQSVVESWWQQSVLGDRTTVPSSWYSQYPPQARVAGTSDVFQSMGLLQVRWAPDGSLNPGSEPLRWKSLAFNVDLYGAIIRYYYDGRCDWCTSGYAAGQQWNSIGAWYDPYPWNNAGAQSYVANVQQRLSERTWAQPDF